MILLLSPSKTLSLDHDKLGKDEPIFLEDTISLNKSLKKYSKPKLAKLMKISDKLAALNVTRNQEFSENFNDENSRSALYTFKGDVYLGLDAESFNTKDLIYAKKHLRILSGLYGLLRPEDKMQPYRLEMGTKLKVGRKKNLYEFWGDKIAREIKDELEDHKTKLIINLASNEYFKAVDLTEFENKVITVHFKEYRNGKLSFVSFNAKKARGLMSKYMIKNKIKTVKGILGFNLEDYAFDDTLSDEHNLMFTR